MWWVDRMFELEAQLKKQVEENADPYEIGMTMSQLAEIYMYIKEISLDLKVTFL